MDDVVVIEAAHHMNDGVHFPYMGQEFVAQSLPAAGSLDEAGDVNELNGGGRHFLRMIHLRQNVQPPVRDKNNARVGLNGTERIVFRLRSRVCDRVEQCAFSDVRKTDNTEFHIWTALLLTDDSAGFTAENYIRSGKISQAFQTWCDMIK